MRNHTKPLLLGLILLVHAYLSNAQVGIGTISPNASAKLEISSSDKGFLPPRVVLTANNLAGPISSPATGLLIYNSATAGSGSTKVTPGYYYYDGSNWQRFESQPQSTKTIACKVEASGIISSVFTGITCNHTPGTGVYTIMLPTTPTYCYPTATISESAPGSVTVEVSAGIITVYTFDSTSSLTDRVFNLICVYSTY